MAGWIHLRVNRLKRIKSTAIKNPVFKPSPIKPRMTITWILSGIFPLTKTAASIIWTLQVAYRQPA